MSHVYHLKPEPDMQSKPAAVTPITKHNPIRPVKVRGAAPLRPAAPAERNPEWKPYYQPNFVKGAPTEVFAIKRMDDLAAIQRYFYDKKQYRNYLFVIMGVSLGLRGYDLTALPWNAILDNDGNFKSPDQCYVYEHKTGKRRPLILHDDVKHTVITYLDKTGIVPDLANPNSPDYWVFAKFGGHKSYRGKPLTPHITRVAIGRILKAAALAVGIPYNVGTHSLRKTFGYRLYKAGVPIEEIQAILNHSSSQMTLRYIGITLEQQTTDIRDLDSILAVMDADDSDD